MKKILVILGHPSLNSLNKHIADSYIKGAKKNFEIKKIYISELKFDPILHKGYKKIQKLEPDLVKAQEVIKWADHLVFVYPIWWTSTPALLKGFFERVFLPGFAFKYNKQGKVEKFLKGKTACIINTAGGPKLWYAFFGRIMNRQVTIGTLKFCGVKIGKQKFIAEIRSDLSKERAEKILEEVKSWGEKGI